MGIKDKRRPVRMQADDTSHLTHYDPAGRALLICEKCLDDPLQAEVYQAITIKMGYALCEKHWRLLT